MKNMAQDDKGDVVPSGNDIYKTQTMGNAAMPPDDPTKAQPKPAGQGA
jgi:hypothetical protein